MTVNQSPTLSSLRFLPAVHTVASPRRSPAPPSLLRLPNRVLVLHHPLYIAILSWPLISSRHTLVHMLSCA
jgi:hypothetical protein